MTADYVIRLSRTQVAQTAHYSLLQKIDALTIRQIGLEHAEKA